MKKLFLYIISILSLFSCQQDLATYEETQSPALEITAYELTEKQAKEILENYLNKNKNKSFTTSNITILNSKKNYISLNKNLETKSTTTLESDIPIYNFSISNNSSELGFALVSGDVRYPSILAHAEVGDINDTIFNKGLAEWYNYTLPQALSERITAYTQTSTDSISSNKESLKLGNHYPAMVEGWEYWYDTRKFSHETTTHTYYYKGGVIEYIRATGFNERLENYTEWDQVAPYNNQCPTLNCNNTATPAYAGCAAIAVAQVMAYHQKGFDVNWQLLKQTSQISPNDTNIDKIRQIGSLIRSIGIRGGMEYKCDGSSMSIEDSRDVLKYYGYKSTILAGDTHPSTLRAELREKRPVIYRGRSSYGGHQWVVDGHQDYIINYYYCYDVYEKSTGKLIDNNYLQMYFGNNNLHQYYYHLNWGWGGSSNGWFIAHDGDNGYNDAQKMLIKIY